MNFNKIYKDFIILAKLFKESCLFAFSQLKVDKFRTFLSLFGVSIGIFSIVAIFTAIDALQTNVKQSLNTFNSNLIQVSKWPMSPEDENGNASSNGEYRWWDFLKRPEISLDDYKFLRKNLSSAKNMAVNVDFNKTAKYKRTSISRASISAVEYEFNQIATIDVEKGRYFTKNETDDGLPVAIIGSEIANELFKDEDPLNKKITIGGNPVKIIGVIKKQGESIVNLSNLDKAILIPFNHARFFVNLNEVGLSIMILPKDNINQDEVVGNIRQLMRIQRRIAPSQKDNFSINQLTFLSSLMDGLFNTIKIVGGIIAAFSLLIGGFGIANIMFVSVKERTPIIGIQKALGAKKYVILTQFLIESALLALAGGLIGILFVFIIIQAIPASSQFTFSLSFANVLSGLGIACIIGILSGILPAWTGASLNPVDAINSK